MRLMYGLFIAAAIFLAWCFWADLSTQVARGFASSSTADELERAGQWGDSFGAFNALASAAGFAVIFATLVVQSRAIRAQGDDQHRQRFESSFFQLLRLLRDLRAEVSFTHSKDYAEKSKKPEVDKEKHGYNAFTEAIFEVSFWLLQRKQRQDTTREQLASIYDEHVHRRHESTLAPYFRMIYTILMRVREDKILTSAEKARYANLLRSNLTSREVYLLAFNGLSDESKDLDELIIEFRMLKYLPLSKMRDRLVGIYGPPAFAARR